MSLINAERQKKYREKLKINDESLYKVKESKRRKEIHLLIYIFSLCIFSLILFCCLCIYLFICLFILTFYPILVYQFLKDHNENKAT